MGAYDGSIRINTKLNTKGFDSGISSMRATLGKFARVIGMAFSITALAKLGKEAIELASDIQEVDNVVSKSFGNMRSEMDALADSAIKNLGMSRLTAYQTGSTFMAMGKSMLNSAEDAKNMALALTKLTANMSSFYNIEQDIASTALKSIYTGETETMKQFGVVMTEVNLQQFAFEQGIQKKISAMTQSEKVMLRYKYVTEQLAFIGNDFIDTQDSWANQVRILKEQWKELLSILGSGLITVLTPVVKTLNTIVSALINFANMIGQILSKIFGIKAQKFGMDETADSYSGIADSAEDATDATEEYGKAVEKAGKKAKEALLPFDQLNVLQQDVSSNSDSSGGNGSGGSGGSGITTEDMVPSGESLLDAIESEIDSLYELGEYIGKALTEAMNSIDWDSIYEKARNFGKGLAEFLNGLISPELFGALGRTIAGALNTVIYAALSFGETFEWEELGLSIATGINEFFNTFDFTALANTIDIWVQGIWNTVYTTLKEIDWKSVWEGAKEFLENLDLETIAIIIGAITIKKIASLHIAKATLSRLGTLLSRKIAQVIASSLGVEIAANAGIGTALTTGLSSVFASLGGLKGIFTTNLSTILGAGTAAEIGMTLGVGVAGAFMAAIGGFELGKWLGAQIFPEMEEEYKNFHWFGENGFFDQMKGSIDDGSFIDALELWKQDIESWLDENLGEWSSLTWSELGDSVCGWWNSIDEYWRENAPLAWLPEWFENDVTPWFTEEKWSELWEGIKSAFSIKWEELKVWWNETAIVGWWNEDVAPWFTQEKWKTLWENVKKAFTGKWNEITEWWKNTAIVKWWNEDVTPWFTKDKWIGILQGVKDAFVEIWEGIKKTVNSVFESILANISAMQTAISGIQAPALSGGVGAAIGNATSSLNIPHLATGAVIPPNSKFLAMLGDQTSGYNIEAPASLIKDMVLQGIQESGGTGMGGVLELNVYLTGKQIHKEIVSVDKIYKKSTGHSAFEHK